MLGAVGGVLEMHSKHSGGVGAASLYRQIGSHGKGGINIILLLVRAHEQWN